jgi:eukaryotic-like serine/threonine-protein kinase
MIGKQVRHYRIDEQIGAGGMGVVYRATDLHLDRPVAIKVLPAHLVSSPDRKKRFIQEAKAASALNHPNIVTIYDVDAAEVDGHTVAFISMEYLAGETLEGIIARGGGAKIKDALHWSIQLAGALAAAHASNIVHRDIKPSNVIVSPDGLAKLLDFGLAKATEPAPQTVDVGAPTEVLAASQLGVLTEEGMIVGTVNYMSPEQAEAKRVDSRSDIFSLGAVLYELFGGSKPFRGDSKIATLSAILHKDPAHLTEVIPGFRDDLDRAILRCLRKEPDRRWQHVSDLRIALEEVRDEMAAGRVPVARQPATPPSPPALSPEPAPSPYSRRMVLPLLGTAALCAVGGVLAGRSSSKREPVTFTRLTYRRGDVDAARFAPDGSIIYSANWEGSPYAVYSLRPGNRESRPLGLGPDTHLAGVSSTGELAIVLASKHTLARVPVSGGTPRELLEDAIEADWSPDGKEMAVVRRSNGRYRLEYPVGKVLHESSTQPMRPRIAPGSGAVAFFEMDGSAGDVNLGVVQAGSPVRVLTGGMRAVGGLAWAPSGREVWISAIRKATDNPAIFSVGLQGETRLLAQGSNWLSIHDVSPGGEILVASTVSRVGIRGQLPGERESRDLSWHENSVVSEMMADGSILMMELGAGEGRNNAIYYQRPGQGVVRLGDGNYPALSPDGKSVVCLRRDEKGSALQIIPTGAGEVREFPGEGLRYQPPRWFSDGRRILFNAASDNGEFRAYTAPAGGGAFTPLTAPGVRAIRVSPDGKWIVASASGRGSWLQSLAHPQERKPVPGLDGADTVLSWTPEGDALLLRVPVRADRTRIVRLNLTDGTRTTLHEVAVPEPGDVFRREFVVVGDGRAYAFSFQRDLASLYLVRGVE